MRRPIQYKQIDPRWSSLPYRVPGEKSTIGGSGCGPTCASMLIETITGQEFNPVSSCKWSVEHGYKAKGQGTFYSYFPAQFKEFGIICKQLNWNSIYGNVKSNVHNEAKMLLEAGGYYIIACMGKGLWTSSGHFVVAYKIEGDTIYINDPATHRKEREIADYNLFKSQVKYYFTVFAPYVKEEEEMSKLTQDEFNDMFAKSMQWYTKSLEGQPPSTYAVPHMDSLISQGIITDPSRPRSLTTREEVLTIVDKAVKSLKSGKEDTL